MNEKLKSKLSKFKILAKKHGPAVLGGIGTVVATAVAVHYRNKVVRYETVDPDEWPSIEISPGAMDRIEKGATLKLRKFKVAPNHTYVQFTTDGEFPPEAEEFYNNSLTKND